MTLQPGQSITAPFLPSNAEVKKFEPRSGYSLLEVVLQDDNHSYKAMRLTPEQLDLLINIQPDIFPIILTSREGDDGSINVPRIEQLIRK